MFEPSRISEQTLTLYSSSITSEDVTVFKTNLMLRQSESVNSLHCTKESKRF
jgi:hypothetical protein